MTAAAVTIFSACDGVETITLMAYADAMTIITVHVDA